MTFTEYLRREFGLNLEEIHDTPRHTASFSLAHLEDAFEAGRQIGLKDMRDHCYSDTEEWINDTYEDLCK